MIPFHIDPRWYQERWYGDPEDDEDDSESGAPPGRLRAGRLGRIVICLALIAAVPALSYLGFTAAARNPAPEAAAAFGN